MVIVHEMGHALKLEHIQNPQAIMHYLLKDQNKTNINLTEDDKKEFYRVCNFNDKNFKVSQWIYSKILTIKNFIR